MNSFFLLRLKRLSFGNVKFCKAFSLVELLVTLIILSLIIATFIPLITKKMKASDITVGSFGSNGGGTIGITRNVTKEDCDKLNAVFVEASTNVPRPLCVLKYNIGDMGNENWAGVQKCDASDTTCKVENGKSDKVTKDNLQPTCWQGKTTSEGNDNFGKYDGSRRTVCNWTGANQLCSNYSLKGIGGWRLPTKDELYTFADEKYSSSKLGAKGLMFCANYNTDSAPICKALIEGCKETYNNKCAPDVLWSETLLNDNARYTILLTNKWNEYSHNLNGAFSSRCVLDSISDIVPPDGGTDLIDNKLDSQADCDKLGAGLLFIPKSTTGTKNMCVMKYNIGDMGNENWAGVQRCSASAACTVENGNSDKVTKDNLTPTCWQGKTGGDGCTDDFGGYGGCTRTVCNWTGGNKMCENYRLGTYGWRLPTKSELISFTNETYSSKTAFESGNGSLMFCDYSKNSISPVCPHFKNSCLNACDDHCYLGHIWSSSFDTTNTAWFRSLNSSDKVWASVSDYLSRAFSIRCVLDEDAYRHANTNQIMPTETEFSSSCENGCALCANDKCYACKQGYELKNGKCETHCLTMNNGICASCEKGYALLNGKCLTCDPSNGFVKVGNICVMQYNIGDGYYRENWGGVQRCIVEQDCIVQNGTIKEVRKESLTPACWQGETATPGQCDANFGGYSGCNRTVCNWTGANRMCINIGWRLPSINELISFTSDEFSSKELGSMGLMLCDHATASSVAPLCYTSYGEKCLNTNGKNCTPTWVWSNYLEALNGASVRGYISERGGWDKSVGYLNDAFSARCVYDL